MSTDWQNIAVMAVTLAIWIGVFVIVFRLDRRVRRLEED